MAKAKTSTQAILSPIDVPPPIGRVVIKSKYDYAYWKPKWTTDKKSLTFPNRTMTLRQIADRFANGLQTIDEKVALYDDGRVVIKNFEKLDLTERQEIVREAEKQMQQIIHERQSAAQAKREQEFSKLVQEKVDAEIKKRETEKAAFDGKNQ